MGAAICSVAQAEADHVARRFVRGHRQTEVAARRLDAARDVRSRIHQRPSQSKTIKVKLLSSHAVPSPGVTHFVIR